uniref:hypothetical protein n=1 Tax=Elmerina hispida TaxID=1245649 RepID=UPI00300135BF
YSHSLNCYILFDRLPPLNLIATLPTFSTCFFNYSPLSCSALPFPLDSEPWGLNCLINFYNLITYPLSTGTFLFSCFIPLRTVRYKNKGLKSKFYSSTYALAPLNSSTGDTPEYHLVK